MVFRAVIIGCLLVIVQGTTGFSQEPSKAQEPEKHLLYEWIDDDDVVHLTDSLDKVPQGFRSTVITRQQAAAGNKLEKGQQQDATPQSVTPNDENLHAQWKERMDAARNQRTASEIKYRQLVQERDQLEQQWGSGLYGYTPDASLKLDELNNQIKQAKRNMDEAIRNIEIVIPEEARKAGIPPGWLRE